MFNRVITISREFGSGGRTIGKKVAEKLGVPCYDAELIQKIAEESGYAADYIKEEGEYGEREESPEQRLKEKDKRRAAYHRFYTDMKWGQAQNYHVCLDSGKLGINRCAELIVQLY